MMRYLFLSLAFLCFQTVALAQTEAPTDKQAAKAAKRAENEAAKAEKKKQETLSQKSFVAKATDVVYVFGVSFNFNDSTVYVTEVQPVSYMKLEKKTKFLPFRSEFSMQLRVYLEGTLGESNQTVSIFYDKNRSKLAKRFYKMKKRSLDMGKQLKVVGSDVFTFKNPFANNENR